MTNDINARIAALSEMVKAQEDKIAQRVLSGFYIGRRDHQKQDGAQLVGLRLRLTELRKQSDAAESA